MVDPNEQLNDPIDQACRTEQQMNEAAISNQMAKWKPEQVQGADGLWPITLCVDCDDPISEERLVMARIRCICCQQDVEYAAARRGNLL